MHIMLPQLTTINFYHLTKTDTIFKKTPDKTSIAMSSVAKTAGMRIAYQERRQLLHNPEVVLMGYVLHEQ